MFIPSDIYTSSGSNLLYGCWTSEVTKYDASSFYNWEQDNLPLHDLEERTHLLWERQGHPISSLTGFSFLVSSNTTSSCNSRVFTTLSACLERLPDSINAPYLIEVASFGNIGDLRLENKTFGVRGSIEIINRNFGYTDGLATGIGSERGIANGVPYLGDSNGLLSGITIADSASKIAHNTSIDFPSVVNDFLTTSSIGLSSLVLSSIISEASDPRLTSNFTIFVKQINPSQKTRLTAALGATNTRAPWAANPSGVIVFNPYEYEGAPAGEYVHSFDASCVNELDDSSILWNDSANTTKDYVAAMAYGNRLQKIKIVNCNGPIYIRNFTVDGGGPLGREYGIEIRNSSQIVVEKCSVARCNKAGLLVDNSDVALTRGFVAYRNYAFKTNSNRAGVPWSSKLTGTHDTTVSSLEEGAGILAINSKLTLSSTAVRDWNLYNTELSGWPTAVSSTLMGSIAPNPIGGSLFCLSKNSIGINAINSIIDGGVSELSGTGDVNQFFNCVSITTELNTEAGISLKDSTLDLNGRLNLYGNFVGIKASNSNITTDMLVARFNQKNALKLVNSSWTYNKNLYKPHGSLAGALEATPYFLHQNVFNLNGNHIDLMNSVVVPTKTYHMPLYYERFIASGHFGYIGTSLAGRQEPAFKVNNGSLLEFVNAGLEGNANYCNTAEASFGHLVSVNDNSEVIFNGTSGHCTKIVGPDGYAVQEFKSAIYVNNNSKCRISGPTVIGQYAVPVFADNNSEIEISPHKTIAGLLDVSGYGLEDPTNHTMVEIHATRSCLVANNNSVINMKDLGDFRTLWANGPLGTVEILSGLDYDTRTALNNTQLYTSAGSLQFYPNPVDVASYTADAAIATIATGFDLYAKVVFSKINNYLYYNLNQYIANVANNFELSSSTGGGVCLRALNGSKVNAKNVHFPAGWWNPSGIIYDVTGADSEGTCNKTFIWNIADDSQLHASYLSVSGKHPADAAYHGPRGVYLAGAAIASGAPIGTLDTSSESVLDFYGSGGTHNFAKTSNSNIGPFRLYFSIKPEANWFLTSALDLSGFIPQVYSQGYQFSGNVTLPVGTVSSFYTSVWRNNGGVIGPSGFFYGSAILTDPNTTRVILDDSASNVFANAKHCSVGKSGMGQVVSIFFPYTEIYGGDSAGNAYKQYGRGFKSANVFDLEGRN